MKAKKYPETSEMIGWDVGPDRLLIHVFDFLLAHFRALKSSDGEWDGAGIIFRIALGYCYNDKILLESPKMSLATPTIRFLTETLVWGASRPCVRVFSIPGRGF